MKRIAIASVLALAGATLAFGQQPANPAKPGVDGFFSLYTLKTGTVDDPIGSLDPSGPAAGASEYVPELSFMMRDFRLFSIDFELQVEVIPVPLVPSIEGPNISLSGDFVFDVWTTSDVDATIGTPLGDIGFRNIADYKDYQDFARCEIDGINLAVAEVNSPALSRYVDELR